LTGTALVTGGAGFIGSELVAQLVGDGRKVRVLDNFATGRAENLREHLGPRCELMPGDVRDRDTVARALAEVDVVFHLACLGVRHSIHAPLENHAVNAEATLLLLAESRARGVRRFVCVSTSEVYGTARAVPMTEEHPTFPHTVYGASKLAGECYARAFHRTHGFPTVVVRPFNAFGPRSHHEGDSGEVIPKFVLRALAGRPLIVFGDGTQTRDFTFVSDTARGIRLAGEVDAAVGQTINLGRGDEISITNLAREVARVVTGGRAEVRHEPPRPGDVGRLCADAAKARAILGFEPRVGLTEGLERLRAWYAASGRAPKDLLAEETVRNWER
jgi:UDP-glucose 4-epimerase